MNRPLVESPFAIVGMACRLPGADNLDEYWQLLREGRSAIRELPAERLDRELYYDARPGLRGKTYSTLGGVIPERPLDLQTCPLDPQQLDRWDPCHLILTEVASAACVHAGYDPRDMPLRRAGVYIGHSGGSRLGGDLIFSTLADETLDHLRDLPCFAQLPAAIQDATLAETAARIRTARPRRTPSGGPEIEANAAARLVAQTLGLTGPQLVIDAACASSLVALATGALALRAGQIDMALVGGASYNKVDSLILFSQARSCSATGSRPFDEQADGLISSEGYVALVMKTLERAIADGDTVHAVLRGVGISSDGRGRSLWAPRKQGQVEAIRRAYGPELEPRSIQYLETHATSTQVGDATEMEALAECFGPESTDHAIPIGSVKSNIGHTLETAGLASLLKAILAMQHGLVPPTINLEKPSHSIPWGKLPFYVARELTPWPAPADGRPRRAGVNAFGIGGLNVHLLVEQFVPLPTSSLPTNSAVPQASWFPTEEPIAIIGRGVVLPDARSVGELDQLIRSGRSAISEAPGDRWRPGIGVRAGRIELWCSPTNRGGFIRDYRYASPRHRVPPKQLDQANPLQFMLLDAASQALAEAGLDRRPYDQARTSVVVGTIFGGEFGSALQVGSRLPELTRELHGALVDRAGLSHFSASELCDEFRQLFLQRRPALLDETGSFTSSTLASRITKELNLTGGAMAIDGGDCSSFAALDVACQLLSSGVSSHVLCAGAQRAMDLPTYETLSRLGWLVTDSHGALINGYLPGEGVAVLLLKRLSDARRDGDRVLGVVSEVAGAFDPQPTRDAYSGNPPDRREPDVAFGAQAVDFRDSALIEQFGHTKAAHGLVSMIAATLTTRAAEATSPATAPAQRIWLRSQNGQAYHVKLSLEQASGTAPEPSTASEPCTDSSQAPAAGVTAVVRPQSTVPGTAVTGGQLSIAAGSSHIGSCIVGSSGAAGHARIWRLGAPCWRELPVCLERAIADPASWLQSAQQPFAISDHGRLAIVAHDPQAAIRKLILARERLQEADGPHRWELAGSHRDAGVFCCEVPVERPRVAFLFPGQGAQYPGMLRGLVDGNAAARLALSEADAVMHGLGYESFGAFAWDNTERLGTDIWVTQTSVLLADLLLHAAVLNLGLRPDVVSGHSFGEYAALVAAGVWTLEQATRASRARADAILWSPSQQGALLSIHAEPHAVAAWIARENQRIFLTHQNAPQQTVVGGYRADVLAFMELMQREKITAQLLPVPAAYHTPLQQVAQEPLRKALANLEFRPPTITVASNVTNRYVAEPAEFRDNLVQQLVTPVRYADLIQRLVADGVGVLVEVGPGQVLTRLHRQILLDTDADCIATDARGLTSEESLLRLQALGECLGLIEGITVAAAGRASGSGQRASHAATPSSTIESLDATANRRKRRRREARAPESDKAEVPATGAAEAQAVPPSMIVDRLPPRLPLTPAPSVAVLPTQKSASDPSVAGSDLQRFLIDFVVEHTGYAADVIELDWDLEADLGIDSIKLAQLFGELRELIALDDTQLQLDQFRTLRQILEKLETSARLPGSVGVEPHGRRTDGPPPSGAHASHEVQQFLVDFVVEHTGYTPELIELDADFEADLGIDSIKLAQLFGELQQQFSLPHDAQDRSSLTGFRTLRQVLALFARPIPEVFPSENGNGAHTLLVAEQVPTPGTAAFDVGRQQGERHAAQIRSLLRQWCDRLPADNLTDTLGAVLEDAAGDLAPFELDTVRGLAAGAGVDARSVIAYRRAHGVCPGSDCGAPAGSPLVARGDATSVAAPATPTPAPPTGPEWISVHKNTIGSSPRGITSRYVLRMQPAPQRAGAPSVPKLSGDAVVFGDNALAHALRERLQEHGVTAHIVASDDEPSRTVTALERIWRQAPVPHLFIVTPRDAEAKTAWDRGMWVQRRQRGLMSPYWFCQKWMALVQAARLMDQASIVAALALGGGFGFEGQIESAESGGLAGLLKSIVIESWVSGFRTFPIKLVDAPGDEPNEHIAAAMLRELAVPSYDIETSWAGGQRRVVRAIPQSAPAARQPIPRGGTWVCTGGARGITAYVARELALRYGLKLHLIGTAPLPELPASWRDLTDDARKQLKMRIMSAARPSGRDPVETWQDAEKAMEIDATLRDLAGRGITARYHSCDTSDREALASVLDRIRQADGPVQGVLHGAGYGRDARFDRKLPEKVERCIRAKVDGTLALMELTQGDPLRYFVGFGSISGRFGANGHTDYSLANDMLAKLIGWYRDQRPDVAALTFHWHAWGDVGMATKPETQLALEMVGMQFMPAAEGLRHVINELEAGAPEREVLITDERYYRLFYPAETLVLPTGEAMPRQVGYPLLDGGHTEELPDEQVTTLTLDPTAEPFLSEHRLEDRPLLPLVIGVELLAEAAARLQGETVRVVRDIQAHRGLRFFGDAPQTIRIRARRLTDGAAACELSGDFAARNGRVVDSDRMYLIAVVACTNGLEPERIDPLAGPADSEPMWQTIDYPPRGSKFYLGPPLQRLRRIRIHDEWAVGQIVAPSLVELSGPQRSVLGWLIPSAALDACLYATGLLAWSKVEPGIALPVGIRELWLGRSPEPGEACEVQTRLAHREPGFAEFHFRLFGDNGDLILAAQHYRIAWLLP